MGGGLKTLQLGNGIADNVSYRHLLIHKAVHERSIGAIFEQPPDQIRKQILVFAHGGIHPHRGEGRELTRGLRVEQPAHAMQPLKLEIRPRRRQFQHRCNAVRVVGGKLWVDKFGVLEQPAYTCQIRHVGRKLAGIDRIALQPTFLSEFNLGIPIGTFHQAHCHSSTAALCGRGRPIDDLQGPLAVGLHSHSKPRPITGSNVSG